MIVEMFFTESNNQLFVKSILVSFFNEFILHFINFTHFQSFQSLFALWDPSDNT